MKNSREFFSCVLPSLAAFALSGVYAVVDGFFVGNSIGDAGLAVINFAFPVTALLQAAGTGIGMGGAIRFAICAAQGDEKTARHYFSATLILLALCGALLSVQFFVSAGPLLKTLGARGAILPLGREYLIFIAAGALFQVFGTGLVPLIRNMGGSLYAMFAMSAGFIANIVLDWLFIMVFGWGMAGAAVATVIGQAATALCAAFYFAVKRYPPSRPPVRMVLRLFSVILKIALSPFGITFSPMIGMMLMNRFSVLYGGEGAVACYACVGYIVTIVYLLLQGVGDGCQPLISRYYGSGRRADMRRVCLLAYMTAGALSLLSICALYLARGGVGELFGASEAVGRSVARVLPLFLAGVSFLAFTRITAASFYATEESRLSYILVYAEPLFLLAFLLLMPRFFGLTGVWLATPASQAATAAIASAARRKAKALNPSRAGRAEAAS